MDELKILSKYLTKGEIMFIWYCRNCDPGPPCYLSMDECTGILPNSCCFKNGQSANWGLLVKKEAADDLKSFITGIQKMKKSEKNNKP